MTGTSQNKSVMTKGVLRYVLFSVIAALVAAIHIFVDPGTSQEKPGVTIASPEQQLRNSVRDGICDVYVY